MKNKRYILPSLTRIASFEDGFDVKKIQRQDWADGDYVVTRVDHIGSSSVQAELSNGRMMHLMEGDLLVGALGVRHATLEATGSWKEVKSDGQMHILTGAGLMGLMTSRSIFVTPLIDVSYQGHVFQNLHQCSMVDYRDQHRATQLTMPAIIFVGTSMSSGKTTSARIVTRVLKRLGMKVAAGKLTGAGRYRDILSIADAGANFIVDFVDAGLPSSICPPSDFRPALENMIAKLNNSNCDIAVLEIGASPLEPYNGDMAIGAIGEQIKCTILCASDPYSVLGVMTAFNIKPTLVSGPAVNTIAGAELIKKLCDVESLNLIMPENQTALEEVISQSLDIS